MPSPFPGMDPYLEHPALWPDVHNAWIAELRRRLGPLVRPRYYIGLEERTYLADPDEGLVLVGRPDLTASGGEPAPAEPELAPASGETVLSVQVPLPDEVRETYLVVRAAADEEVVAVVELLSPTHKRPGEGRRRYLEKRRAVLASRTHLVEVDLLRAGEPMPTRGADRSGDYRALISRSERRPHAELRLFSVRDPLPSFPLPLRPGDAEPRVELRAALDEIYDTGGYDLRIGYAEDPAPPLDAETSAWADARLRDAGLR